MNRLREVREERGLSTYECAKLAGISRRALIRYESGANVPGIYKAMRLARILGVAVSDLWREDQTTSRTKSTSHIR